MDEYYGFKYKGKNLEDLQKMSLRDFSVYVSSRARRNLLRNESDVFYQKFEKNKDLDKNIRTHRRDLIVTPKMVGKTVNVYNGKEFVPVVVMEEMLGHYLGEFALTRKRLRHGKAGIGATKSSTAISERK
jgi:small subunit ribosomal protein S19